MVQRNAVQGNNTSGRSDIITAKRFWKGSGFRIILCCVIIDRFNPLHIKNSIPQNN
jgi:hypothetical protein